MGYRATWQSSDQIPKRAIDSGALSRLGHVDPTTGGESQRYSLNIAFQTTNGDVVTKGNLYGIYYNLDLFSNFTYHLDDQFQQKEQRWILGGALSRTWLNQSLFHLKADHTLGFQTRMT